MNPRRILIFSLAYLPQVGGAEIAIKEITDRIDPADIEFHLITLRMSAALPRKEKMGNVTVYRIGRGSGRLAKLWFQFAAPQYAARLNKRVWFDGVWAMMAHSAGIPAALFKMRHPETAYLLTLQEGDPPEYIERVMRPLWPLFARAFTRADMVQVISHFLGSWARSRGYYGPLEIIPNGVNGTVFSREITLEEKAAVRQRHNLGMDDRIALTVSRLVAKNGIDLVIRALAANSLSAGGANAARVTFLIIGDGPERHKLEELAAELGVAGRVIFAGYVDNARVPAYLHASDMFIRASRSEGQGIAFIEAMAAGIPVIAPLVGGISDFLFDEERSPEHEPTGFAIDPESPESIVGAVTRIIDDPLRAHQIAINAQRIVLREYDWDNIANEMKTRVFDKLLNSNAL